MGHVVHPIGFRLGISRSWNASWFENDQQLYIKNLQQDFLLYRYISGTFKYSTAQRHLSDERGFREKLKPNVFIKEMGIVFSHLNISRIRDELNLNIFCYDGTFEEFKQYQESLLKSGKRNFRRKEKKIIKEKDLYNLIFPRSRVLIEEFRDQLNQLIKAKDRERMPADWEPIPGVPGSEEPKVLQDWGVIRLKYFFHRVVGSHQGSFKRKPFSRSLALGLHKTLPLLLRRTTEGKRLLALFLNSFLKVPYLSFSQFADSFLKGYSFFKIARVLKLLYILLFVNNKGGQPEKIKILLILFVRLTLQLFHKLRRKRVKGGRNFVKLMLRVLIYGCMQEVNRGTTFLAVQKVYGRKKKNRLREVLQNKIVSYSEYRTFSWFYYAKMLRSDVVMLTGYNKIGINIYSISNANVTAAMIAFFIARRLEQKYSIKEVLAPIVRHLRTHPFIGGFKIVTAGRLTKAQRASLTVKQRGSVPLSSTAATIDYATDLQALRHGVAGIKVWINKMKGFSPYSYRLSLKFEKNKKR